MTLSSHAGFRRSDFFTLIVPKRVAAPIIGSLAELDGTPAFVMALDRSRNASIRSGSGVPVPILPFPHASRALAAFSLEPEIHAPRADDLEAYVPRAVFDNLADEVGAERIGELPLCVGMAADDPVMGALDKCLSLILEGSPERGGAVVDAIAHSLNVHLAERYGHMRRPPGNATGGLAPWQLRLATRAFRNINSPSSLDDMASACGLSIGHFSRAFKRSTGSSPHQWIVLRRVEAAKDLIGGSDLPLAEIALACHFSDQSHLTRAFANVIGVTPGRWRATPEVNALSPVD